jgi:autotransporter strand-loop-strand O-heptosyltransferase
MYTNYPGSDEMVIPDTDGNKNFYIVRKQKSIYNILIQRPLIVKHCLDNFSELVCYIDSDSIATPHVDKIFDYFDTNSMYPYFTKGVYSFLAYNGRGNLSNIYDTDNSLENNICKLFDVSQSNRSIYRQTGYFVCNKNCISFLDEWYDWCTHPEVYEKNEHYAPYNEETVVNALLWKKDYKNSLPLVYVNVLNDTVNSVYNTIRFSGEDNHHSSWFKIPANVEQLLFFHGEKRPHMMRKISEQIDSVFNNELTVLHIFDNEQLAINKISELKNFKFKNEYAVISAKKLISENLVHIENEQFLKYFLSNNSYDIIHFHFEIETKMSDEFVKFLFSDKSRKWRIVETLLHITDEYIFNKKFITDAVSCNHQTKFFELNSFFERDINIFYKKLRMKSITKDYMNRNTTPEILFSFKDGYRCEIKSENLSDDYDYMVKFIDIDKNMVLYYTSLKVNHWASPSIKFHRNIRIEVTSSNPVFDKYVYDLNLSGKKVLLKFESSSLGDTIAWFPYVDEFRKKHNCEIYCYCRHSSIFDRKYYADINFVETYDTDDYFAVYELGWFRDNKGEIDVTKNPISYVNQPLQKTAADILNLPFSEIRPKLKKTQYTSPLPDKYFTFSMQSTAQSKYWNFDNGWETLLNLLKGMGYVGICVDKYSEFGINGFMNKIPSNCINLTGLNLDETMGLFNNAKFHIGLSSGVSWLAWASNVPVVLISGFTDPVCEFVENCIRIHNDDVCNGCFTNPLYKFDPSDWLWCPVHKGTDRQFECTKSITPFDVYTSILKSKII